MPIILKIGLEEISHIEAGGSLAPPTPPKKHAFFPILSPKDLTEKRDRTEPKYCSAPNPKVVEQ